MKHVDHLTRAAVVARLREKRATGPITSEVRRVAAALSVGQATVWRWLACVDEPAVRTGRYRLTEADRDAYHDWRGNVAGLWRERKTRGEPVPTLRTLQRAFARELTPGERAAVVDGVDGRRRHEIYLRWQPTKRNALWEGDHKELPVLVTAPRAVRPVKPWVTLFVDAFSRLIMGWALSLRPNAGVVLAALRRGLVVDPERGPFGGIPATLRPDNGLEFVNKTLSEACGALGTELLPTPKYVAHLKGKVERVNRTVDQTLICGLPFYTEGPRAADGRLFGPNSAPMALELFVDRFAEWVTHYNTARSHSALDGQTPLQRWQTDASPVRQVPPEDLRWLLMAGEDRTIQKDGINFCSVKFVAAGLNGRVGERVQVRYTPHDLRQIDIFQNNKWVCTAYPHDLLTEEQRQEVLIRRRADAAELGRRQRRASLRARAKLAAITAPGPLQDSTVITAAHTATDGTVRSGGHETGMAAAGSTDLLGLNRDFTYWNPDLVDLDVAGRDDRKSEPSGES